MRVLRGELVSIKTFVRPFVVKRYFKNNPESKLHIGFGPHLKDGWLNADKFNANADIYQNARRRMPFRFTCCPTICLKNDKIKRQCL